MRAFPNFFEKCPKSRITLVLIIGFTLAQVPHLLPSAAHANAAYAANIVDYAFQPLHINITTGTTVTWTYSSNGATIHTVTSDPQTNLTQSGTPLISSGDLSPGQSFSYTFDLPGYYPYQCSVHPNIPAMNGWIMVTGTPVTSPTSTNSSGNPWLLPLGIVAVVGALGLGTWGALRRRHRNIAPHN